MPQPDVVGLVYARQTGKTFRQAHSGVAYGLAGGMREIGVQQVALIDCAAPRWADPFLARARQVEQRLSTPSLTSVGAVRFARRRSRHLSPGAPIVTLTSRVGGLGPRPLISFEDMTAALARRYPELFGHSDDELARVQARQLEMYGSAVSCCVGSHWAAASLVEDYRIPEAQVHVVGRGHSFKFEPVERDWSVPRFLFMGRDWKRKNGERVVQAFRTVRAEHPNAQLTLVGAHPAVHEPGVKSEGFLDLSTDADRYRLVENFKESTCLVMPSLVEPFGLSYLEAGSFGIPSIGTTIGGAVEAIGRGGLTVDPYQVRDLADAMLKLCVPETARQLGDQAVDNARTFTWPRIAERILETCASAPSA